jgi:hypothetical protein
MNHTGHGSVQMVGGLYGREFVSGELGGSWDCSAISCDGSLVFPVRR